jgi:hypothetical protein
MSPLKNFSIADADFADNVFDAILFRRVYKGTSDSIVLMICHNTATTYYLKLKLFTTVYTISTISLSSNTWHFASFRIACILIQLLSPTSPFKRA